MKPENSKPDKEPEELPDSWWYRVYFGVIIATVAVIFALWSFSKYFS